MSDTHTWNVDIFLPATGSVNIVESSVSPGDYIHADFTWERALQCIPFIYARLHIYDPDGIEVEGYDEFVLTTGSKQLTHLVEKTGTYTAELQVCIGQTWIYFSDTVTSYGPDMKIEPDSEFFTGPFIAGTMQRVCSIYVRNYGNASAPAHIELWEYPNTSSQELLGSWITQSVEPGTTIQRDFEITIPDETYWPLGVKVWGQGELEPSW